MYSRQGPTPPRRAECQDRRARRDGRADDEEAGPTEAGPRRSFRSEPDGDRGRVQLHRRGDRKGHASGRRRQARRSGADPTRGSARPPRTGTGTGIHVAKQERDREREEERRRGECEQRSSRERSAIGRAGRPIGQRGRSAAIKTSPAAAPRHQPARTSHVGKPRSAPRSAPRPAGMRRKGREPGARPRPRWSYGEPPAATRLPASSRS